MPYRSRILSVVINDDSGGFTMTALSTAPAGTTTGRRLLGRLAPVGPIAMAGWALAVPYHVGEPTGVWIPAVAANMGRVQLSMWMMLIFALTAGAGAIVTGLVARRGSPRLGTVGLVLTFAGFSAMGFSGTGYDGTAAAGMGSGLDLGATERLIVEVDKLQAPTIGSAVFMPIMAAGVIILGVALWRGRAVPRWAAIVLVAAFPVIFVGGLVSMMINAAGWLLLAVGFAVVGRAFGSAEAS
jgi:hypothetical protein